MLEAVMASFRDSMVRRCGLTAGAVIRSERTAGRLLGERALHGEVLHVATLTGAVVNAHLSRECARVSAGSAKGRVAELRAELPFLYLDGRILLQLGGAVPPVVVGDWPRSPG